MSSPKLREHSGLHPNQSHTSHLLQCVFFSFSCFKMLATNLIQTNGWLSGFSRARWRADHLSRVCWSRETSNTCSTRGSQDRTEEHWSRFLIFVTLMILMSKIYSWEWNIPEQIKTHWKIHQRCQYDVEESHQWRFCPPMAKKSSFFKIGLL